MQAGRSGAAEDSGGEHAGNAESDTGAAQVEVGRLVPGLTVDPARTPDLSEIPPTKSPDEVGAAPDPAETVPLNGGALKPVTVQEVTEFGAQLTADGLVNLAQSMMVMACRVVCANKGVEFDEHMRRTVRLAPDEREELEGTAEFAVPYVKRFLSNANAVGAAMFGLSFATIVATRFAAIKAAAKPTDTQKKRAIEHAAEHETEPASPAGNPAPGGGLPPSKVAKVA